MNSNTAEVMDVVAQGARQQVTDASGLGSRRISDYLDHQSHKSASFFEGEGNLSEEWEQMAQGLKASRACVEKAIATAHLAQMDDYDMPPLPVGLGQSH